MTSLEKANSDCWTYKHRKKERENRCSELLKERALDHREVNEQIVSVLRSCKKKKRCGKCSCPVCVHHKQNNLFKAARKCIAGYKNHCFVTLISRSPVYYVDNVDDLDLAKAKNRFKQQLRRAFSNTKEGTCVIGVIEPSYDRTTKAWHYHFHIVCLGRNRRQIGKLRKLYKFKTPRGAPACRASNIKPTRADFARCISYISKFVTYERSKEGLLLSQRAGDAVRLKRSLHNELLRFYHNSNFDSFVFKIGLGPRGLPRPAYGQ